MLRTIEALEANFLHLMNFLHVQATGDTTMVDYVALGFALDYVKLEDSSSDVPLGMHIHWYSLSLLGICFGIWIRTLHEP